MKNYIEHEIEVRFIEGILERSQDWQWFIYYLEENYEPDLSITTFEDFRTNLNMLSDPFSHLVRIDEISLGTELAFSKLWLKSLYKSAQIRNGKMNPAGILSDDSFFSMLNLTSYAVYLINSASEKDLLFSLELFNTTNLFEKYDFSNLLEKRDILIGALNNIDLEGLDIPKDTLEKNLNGEKQSHSDCLLSEFLDSHFHQDIFNMANNQVVVQATWQERLLFEMPMAGIRELKLIPRIQIGGVSSPEINQWEEGSLDKLIAFFSNEKVTCIIETAKYFLYDSKMSDRTLELHFELLISHIKSKIDSGEKLRNSDCTSLKVISCVAFNGTCPKNIKDKSMPSIMAEISKLDDIGDIAFIDKHHLPTTKDQKDRLVCAMRASAERIFSITESSELCRYLTDSNVERFCTQECAEEALQRFISMINEKGIATANLFYCFLKFGIGLLSRVL